MSTPLRLLLVEDSAADVALIEELVGELELPVELHVARDGERALRFLRRQGEYGEAPRPDLVLLDLNLPARSGLEVLDEVRNDPDEDLRVIPVLVLTTSRAPDDVHSAYRLAANAFVTKPIEVERLRQVVHSIGSFWMESASLPGTGER
jgi:CheY-like chemotaxis protein